MNKKINGHKTKQYNVRRIVNKEAEQEYQELDMRLDDTLYDLKESYGSKFDTIQGVLEILESYFIACDGGEYPRHEEFKLVYLRFKELIRESSKQGLDVSVYKKIFSEYLKIKPKDYNFNDENPFFKDRKKEFIKSVHTQRLAEIVKGEDRVNGRESFPTIPVYYYNPALESFEAVE
jgi:hypothetical protein